MNVVLVRWVGYEGDGQYYAVRADLPMAPFPGLGVPVHADRGPFEIRAVCINQCGEVVARVKGEDWSRDHCKLEDWPQQLAWLTRGWEPMGKDPCWECGPFQEETVP